MVMKTLGHNMKQNQDNILDCDDNILGHWGKEKEGGMEGGKEISFADQDAKRSTTGGCATFWSMS